MYSQPALAVTGAQAGVVSVPCVKWVCLPGRSKERESVHADPGESGKGRCCYSVDVALPYGGSEFKEKIVQVERVFIVETANIPRRSFAYVTVGTRVARDSRTQCWEYDFKSSAPVVMGAERLISYVHFGLLNGDRRLLNRFYIPV